MAMALTRTCDIEDCENDALFMVGVWNENDSKKLDDTRDVCGEGHARVAVKNFLNTLADIQDAP